MLRQLLSRLNPRAVRLLAVMLGILAAVGLAVLLSGGCRREHRYHKLQAATRAEQARLLQQVARDSAQAVRFDSTASHLYRAASQAADSARHYHQLATDALNSPIAVADTSRLHRILATFDWR